MLKLQSVRSKFTFNNRERQNEKRPFSRKDQDLLDFGGLDERHVAGYSKIDSTLISVSYMCTIKDNIPDANTQDFWAWSSRPKTPHFAL